MNFEKSKSFCAKKCGRLHLKNPPCPHWTNSPDCGRLLWTARYINVDVKYESLSLLSVTLVV